MFPVLFARQGLSLAQIGVLTVLFPAVWGGRKGHAPPNVQSASADTDTTYLAACGAPGGEPGRGRPILSRLTVTARLPVQPSSRSQFSSVRSRNCG